jgi:methionine biosynthesis protein MetW
VLACVRRGVNVIQLNLDEGLAMFGDNSFDVVLQIDTLQHLRNAEVMLRETARVGRTGIVAFPNFAHWPNRLRAVLRGRMPVTRRLPYQWYDTPNIRVGTYKDFEVLAHCKNAEEKCLRGPCLERLSMAIGSACRTGATRA